MLEKPPPLRAASHSREQPSCSSYQPHLEGAAGLEGEASAAAAKMSDKITFHWMPCRPKHVFTNSAQGKGCEKPS